VRGHSYQSVELALDLMARKTIDLDVMSTHHFGLEDVDHALRLVGGDIQDGAIHVTVTPWEDSASPNPSRLGFAQAAH